MQEPAGYTGQKNAELSISHSLFSVFSCVFRISHRFVRCFCRHWTFCTCQLRLAFVFQLRAGVGGGVMTSMRMRLVFSVFFRCFPVRVAFPVCVAFRIGFYGVFAHARLFVHASLNLHLSFSSVRGWGGGDGGGVMTSMSMWLVSSVSFVALLLKRCRLLCEALVAASCCFTFETSTIQKPRVLKLSKQKLRNEPSKSSKIKAEKHGTCDLFAKTKPKTKTKSYGQTSDTSSC